MIAAGGIMKPEVLTSPVDVFHESLLVSVLKVSPSTSCSIAATLVCGALRLTSL